MATTGPKAAAADGGSLASSHERARVQKPLGPPGAYANAAAYAEGHEALLAEIAALGPWLAERPAVAEAVAGLADAAVLRPDVLDGLLALQNALAATTDPSRSKAHLLQRMEHHIQCTRLTMAGAVFARAARTSHPDQVRDLRQMALQGEFITVRESTEIGEVELGQYLEHRDRQLSQQSNDPQGHAQEKTAMAQDIEVEDPDDGFQLPVFEVPGDVVMSVEEAAPRLIEQARVHLAGARADVELLAHVYGRPIYARVDNAGSPEASLRLGLVGPEGEGDPRTVTLTEGELAAVAPDALLSAVTAWMNASDDGGRPLLDYAPSTGAQSRTRAHHSLSQEEEPAVGPAAAATPLPSGAAAPVSQPASAPSAGPAKARSEQTGSRQTSVPPNPATPAPSGSRRGTPPAPTSPSRSPRPTLPGNSGGATPRPAEAAVPRVERHGGTRQLQGNSSEARLGDEERVAAVVALARAVLGDLRLPAEVTGVLTAPRTVLLTLETSGSGERDREVADALRAALSRAVGEHPDQGLSVFRVDVEHTRQVGQGSLDAGQPAPQAVPVPRERLVAANNAAAAILDERLRTDPNAALARTYLAEERALPPEVQQQWGLGYAPSDRGAGRFDVLVRLLTDQGFTEDELEQAGLAKRSRIGTLIDYFDDRITFPIHDEHGDIVGFSGRRIDRPGESEEEAEARQSQKYFNTSNDAVLFSKGDLVFGLHHPAQAQVFAVSRGPRVSVEGYTDVIAVARAAATLPLEQRPVVGAPMGTAFTERQLTTLRSLDTDHPRPHIAFLDADDSGRNVLLKKWDLLLKAAGSTTVTTAADGKDAATLWERAVKAGGDGAPPVLHALDQRQPLLDAVVEAVLVSMADDVEAANRTFGGTVYRRERVASEAARYIHQWAQTRAPGDTAALQDAALTWARRLHKEWSIPGYMTAKAVLLGPGNHREEDEEAAYQQALNLLAADPEGYFVNDSHVHGRKATTENSRATAAQASPSTTKPGGARPGQWPKGVGAGAPVSAAGAAPELPTVAHELGLSMVLPSTVDGRPGELTDRTTAAYALHTAVHDRLGQHSAERPEPKRLPRPSPLGTVHGVELATSGADQTSKDPTIVLWLGPERSDALRLSYSRFVQMTGPEFLAAVEWRAAQAAGLLGAPLSPGWRTAVRTILPAEFPVQPTPGQFADLLDTIAQGPEADAEATRRHAEQAVAIYTAGHPDLALDHLASTDHIWVLRTDGSWIQEETVGTEPGWEDLDSRFSREAAELADITRAAADLPSAGPAPMPADLTVAHHSAHEALSVLRPYSIGLPNTRFEQITDLVAQMDAGQPALRRLHGPDGQHLMNRAKASFVRILEGLATVASKIRLTSLSARLERTVARLRGQDLAALPAPRRLRVDRRMQDLAHIERDLERRMATPSTTIAERGELQEEWIINRARWRARYEQLHGQPPAEDFLPDNGLVAGAPPVPNLLAAHDLLLNRLSARVEELRDTDQHTGEETRPFDPTADLFNGVAWAYTQRLVGAVPSGADPEGPLPDTQLRQAALTVTSLQQASPLILRRSMNVTAERADRLLHRLEEQQIVGPYRAAVPRTVVARPGDIGILLARPPVPTARQAPAEEPVPVPDTPLTAEALDHARLEKIVGKILADRQQRGEGPGDAPAEREAPPRSRRTSVHKEAQANALAAAPSSPLIPSQS